MPRNSPRPTPRHKAPRRLRRPRQASPRGTRVGSALRWIAVTPTFAVGLGVVIAAALGAPAPSVVLSTAPYGGIPCEVKGCASVHGNGMLTTRPGSERLLTPARKRTSPGRSTSGRSAGAFLVEYRTLGRNWDGTFTGEIVVASRTGKPLPAWTLWFSYPSGQVDRVWATAPVRYGPHTVTVSSARRQGGRSGSQQGQGQVVFLVSGPAGRPAGCTINGQPCHIVTVTSGWSGGGWNGSAQNGGSQNGGSQNGGSQNGGSEGGGQGQPGFGG